MRVEFRSEKRGYLLALERDMFNVFVLSRRWYGLGNRRGGVKRQIFLDEDAALREVRRIERLRLRRGYRVIDPDSGK
jgi:predicted DNA-binding WGR domain protein